MSRKADKPSVAPDGWTLTLENPDDPNFLRAQYWGIATRLRRRSAVAACRIERGQSLRPKAVRPVVEMLRFIATNPMPRRGRPPGKPPQIDLAAAAQRIERGDSLDPETAREVVSALRGFAASRIKGPKKAEGQARKFHRGWVALEIARAVLTTGSLKKAAIDAAASRSGVEAQAIARGIAHQYAAAKALVRATGVTPPIRKKSPRIKSPE